MLQPESIRLLAVLMSVVSGTDRGITEDVSNSCICQIIVLHWSFYANVFLNIQNDQKLMQNSVCQIKRTVGLFLKLYYCVFGRRIYEYNIE